MINIKKKRLQNLIKLANDIEDGEKSAVYLFRDGAVLDALENSDLADQAIFCGVSTKKQLQHSEQEIYSMWVNNKLEKLSKKDLELLKLDSSKLRELAVK